MNFPKKTLRFDKLEIDQYIVNQYVSMTIPCEYIDVSINNEIRLPSIDKFYSSLTDKNVTECEFKIA